MSYYNFKIYFLTIKLLFFIAISKANFYPLLNKIFKLPSAKITIAGIENIRIIQKGQIIGSNDKVSTFENFKMLMAA